MGRRARAGIVSFALALTALSSCGASGTSPTESPTRPADRPDTEPAARPGGRGIALKRIGSFESPVYVSAAPGFPKLLFVVEQGGSIEVLRGGGRLGRPFLDISPR